MGTLPQESAHRVSQPPSLGDRSSHLHKLFPGSDIPHPTFHSSPRTSEQQMALLLFLKMRNNQSKEMETFPNSCWGTKRRKETGTKSLKPGVREVAWKVSAPWEQKELNLNLWCPCKKPGMAVNACNPSTGDRGTSGSWKPLGQLGYLKCPASGSVRDPVSRQ